MLDLYMILLLAGMFACLYGFIVWCGRVAEQGEDRS